MTSDCILKKVLGIYEKINPRLPKVLESCDRGVLE
jgi:hypothetical protein